MPDTIPNLSASEGAAAIMALINSSPRSPRQDEIEAILARITHIPGPNTSPLLETIRGTAARLGAAFDAYGKFVPSTPGEAEAQALIDSIQTELEGLEGQIPNPPRSFLDLLAWAEIAYAGAGHNDDGSIYEVRERDVFVRPSARLVEAVLHYRGALSGATAMSPAHAEHYREWRGLIDQHMREFEPGRHVDGEYTEAVKAEEARMSAHMDVIDALADKILAAPVLAWGDLLPCAEVAFWYQWAGVDPEGPDARGQMDAGPMSGGKAIDQAVAKVLSGIFTLAGVGQFAAGAVMTNSVQDAAVA